MLKQFYLIVLISFLSLLSLAQTKINGVVNAYATVSELDEFSVTVDNSNSFSSNDLVLIIQMKGATIDETLSNDFGSITAFNGAGKYEFQRVCSVDGNRVYFKNCLLNDYDKVGAVQLIKVAEYTNAELDNNLTCTNWNGSTGGVIAIKANTLDLKQHNIDASEKGFRGGEALASGGGCVFVNLATQYTDKTSANDRAHKGEGIAEFILGKECSRGPQANGGGGGNNHNGGGSGGANYGLGGAGGQRVKSSAFSCGSVVGLDAKSLATEITNGRLFLGGGGGAGHGNNPGFTGEPGHNGGGLIFIIADNLTGSGSIIANGGSGTQNTENEGGGGGGAGGTVVLDVNNFSGVLGVSANGGNGTYVDNIGSGNCSGPGGGGGAGVVITTTSSIPVTLTVSTKGGLAGEIASSAQSGCNVGDKNGANNGGNGTTLLNASLNYHTQPFLKKDTVVACNSYTSPSGKTWESDGVYLDTTTHGGGCEIVTEYKVSINKLNGGISNVSDMNQPYLYMTLDSSANYQWYKCQQDTLKLLVGKTKRFFDPMASNFEPGFYTVVQTKRVCVDTADCFQFEFFGIDGFVLKDDITISPNPTSNYFSVNTKSYEIKNIRVLDLNGKELQTLKPINPQQAESRIETAGVYFIEVKTENGVARKKLVVH